MSAPIVTLLTDFGTSDPFVGIMHGVILSRCPEARVVDLCHGISAQSVDQAAFWLARSVWWFPAGTTHVAVVDPGVGTDREAVVVAADGQRFVAPDNGLLSPIVARAERVASFAVDTRRLGLQVPSRTFHGRDIFAPVGAELAAGRISPHDVGPHLDRLVQLSTRGPEDQGARVQGHVVTIDRFGNLITDIDQALIERFDSPAAAIGARSVPFAKTYGEVAPGELVALVNAFDTIEVACRDGSAADTLGLGCGEPVVVGESAAITT